MKDDDIYLCFLMNETLLCKMTSRNPCMGDITVCKFYCDIFMNEKYTLYKWQVDR